MVFLVSLKGLRERASGCLRVLEQGYASSPGCVAGPPGEQAPEVEGAGAKRPG